MKTDEMILIGALGIGLLYVFSKKNFISGVANRVSGSVMETGEVVTENIKDSSFSIASNTGEAIVNIPSGLVVGAVKGTLINPYEWSKNYKGHIPIIDPLAKAFVRIKRLGKDDRWFW